MEKFMIKSYLALLVMVLVAAGCAGTKKSAVTKYTGEWEYLVENTPNGDVRGVMLITHDDNGFVGKLTTSDMGEIELNELVIVEDKLSANFTIQGMMLEMAGLFEGPEFNGNISIDYNNFPMTATKKVD